jgi:hypothetical protein
MIKVFMVSEGLAVKIKKYGKTSKINRSLVVEHLLASYRNIDINLVNFFSDRRLVMSSYRRQALVGRTIFETTPSGAIGNIPAEKYLNQEKQ